jgi:6,7-dimethyl-8-ribityllumazine synthase
MIMFCNAVERGCSQLQLEFGKPVAFGVLTTENKDQAKARCGGRKGNKGAEAAQVALDMLQVLGEISNLKG